MGYLNYELDNNEQFITMIRKHWVTLTACISRAIISIVIIVVIYEKLTEFEYGFKIALIWIIASILYGVYGVMIWYLDCYIITNRRIIDIDQKSMFKRIVAEVEIGNIQEVVYEIDGPLETLFNYGTVKVKMANGGIVGMEQIPNPAGVKDLIVKTQRNGL